MNNIIVTHSKLLARIIKVLDNRGSDNRGLSVLISLHMYTVELHYFGHIWDVQINGCPHFRGGFVL